MAATGERGGFVNFNNGDKNYGALSETDNEKRERKEQEKQNGGKSSFMNKLAQQDIVVDATPQAVTELNAMVLDKLIAKPMIEIVKLQAAQISANIGYIEGEIQKALNPPPTQYQENFEDVDTSTTSLDAIGSFQAEGITMRGLESAPAPRGVAGATAPGPGSFLPQQVHRAVGARAPKPRSVAAGQQTGSRGLPSGDVVQVGSRDLAHASAFGQSAESFTAEEILSPWQVESVEMNFKCLMQSVHKGKMDDKKGGQGSYSKDNADMDEKYGPDEQGEDETDQEHEERMNKKRAAQEKRAKSNSSSSATVMAAFEMRSLTKSVRKTAYSMEITYSAGPVAPGFGILNTLPMRNVYGSSAMANF